MCFASFYVNLSELTRSEKGILDPEQASGQQPLLGQLLHVIKGEMAQLGMQMHRLIMWIPCHCYLSSGIR